MTTSSLVPGQPQDSVEEMAPPPFGEMKDSQPPRVVQMQSDMAEKLTAAKPVSWRGRGDLPQAVWCTPPKGTILVIELWSGISGLSLALLSVGATFYAAAAETNPDARACAQASMPHIAHYPSVEALVAEDFRGLLTRRKPRAVILGGGSPCQGNSSLNKDRKGLQDVRSQQPWHLFRLRNEFRALPEMVGIALIIFLENVASMPKQVCRQYSEWLKCSPVMVEAGCFGWVHRRRLYWLASDAGHLSTETTLPAEWTWVPPTELDGILELRYQGKKPFPARIAWEQGFTPLFDPAVVMRAGGHGGFHTFTREFFHPSDRVATVSAEAASRFFADNRRFPPGAYEDHSLLWNRSHWRQPSSSERCGMMAIPPASVAVFPPGRSESQREQVRNSLVGNGFHLPSVMMLMCLLPALMEAKFNPGPTLAEVDSLPARVAGTIWEPGRLEVWPGLLQGHEVAEGLSPCFPDLSLPPELVREVGTRLSACRLHRLQESQAWGLDTRSLGPTPIFGRDRSWIYAGLSGQRYPSSSSRGLDHLLPPGLGMTNHIQAAQQLPSPFAPRPWPEADVQFVVEYIVKWQRCLIARAAEQRHILQAVAQAVRPLEQWLDEHRCESSRLVAAGKRPGFCAVMAILLRWPDMVLGQEMVRGFPIVGQLSQSGVFRTVTPETPPDLATWLGTAAEDAITKITHSGPPRFHEDILEVTQDEQQKHFCSPFMTKLEVDDRFGVGQWRPMERFMIVQADGKKRVIDNARKSQHNEQTTLFETIHTVSVDFVASVASMLAAELPVGQDSLPWLNMRLGTDDLPDAYRGLPVCDSHLCFSIVAVYVAPLGWRFTILHGLAYGLESAVVSFNRVPQLGIAISRRCCAAPGSRLL